MIHNCMYIMPHDNTCPEQIGSTTNDHCTALNGLYSFSRQNAGTAWQRRVMHFCAFLLQCTTCNLQVASECCERSQPYPFAVFPKHHRSSLICHQQSSWPPLSTLDACQIICHSCRLSAMATSILCQKGLRRYTTDGLKTSRTGASAGSCGGVIASLSIMPSRIR